MMDDSFMFENWHCPKCHSRGPFHVSTKATTSKTADGANVHEEANRQGGKVCICGKCSYSGPVAEFNPSRQSSK